MSKHLSKLQVALRLYRGGFVPIPMSGDKKPLVKWSKYKTEMPTEDGVRSWPWERAEVIAILCRDDIVGLDFDDPAEFNSVRENVPQDAYVEQTPRGGYHVILKMNNPQKNGKAQHCEIKSNGVLINIYKPETFNPSRLPTVKDISDLAGAQYSSKYTDTSERLTEGRRNSWLFSLAGSMRRRGFNVDAIRAALAIENEKRCDPPLPDDEIYEIARGITRYPTEEEIHCTEAAAGEIFADKYCDTVRFDHDLGEWYIWDKTRWKKDDKEEVIGLIKGVTEEYSNLANDQTRTQEERNSFFKFALSLENRMRISNALNLARSDKRISVTGNVWDNNPYLLNCLNGTIDLQTLKLLPHNPSNNISHLCQAEYNPGATCVRWVKFLCTILPSEELRAFVQRVNGYCLSGLADAQKFFFLWGSGSNGKSVLISMIEELLGDYATRIRSTSIMKNGQRDDLLRLRGARAAFVSELDVGEQLAESQIKEITGQDTFTVRPLYRHSLSFKTPAKLIIVGNHKPRIIGTDHGIWRRVILIPFNQVIPELKQRPMTDLLKEFRLEISGILNWAIAGWRAYQNGGLRPPQEVNNATSEYRRNEDRIADFLALYERTANDKMPLKELYNQYINWACGENIRYPMSKPAFTDVLRERDINVFVGTNNQRFVGLKRIKKS